MPYRRCVFSETGTPRDMLENIYSNFRHTRRKFTNKQTPQSRVGVTQPELAPLASDVARWWGLSPTIYLSIFSLVLYKILVTNGELYP